MQEIHCNLPLQSVQLKVESYNKDRGSMMTANRRSVRKRRSKHKGSMKVITLIVLVLCGVFGVFTWQNTQKSEQYALVQENLQQQIDDEEENQKAIEEQAEYQKTDAYIEDLAREKLGLVHEDEIIFKKK
ncbi:MAG: septum formation initiator family protein [Coprococcus catus]|nr:septum formation initiator family protein [Coprococcus catus]